MSAPSDIAAAAQGLAAALLGATADPADALRLLSELAAFSPSSSNGTDAIGTAINDIEDASGDLYRRAAVVAMARASTTYQPSSYDDAAAVRQAVVALLDNEITIAADQGEDASYTALRALRVTVIQDLTTRGANLAPITTFNMPGTMPALPLATRLYRDPARGDQLVTQVDPVSPLFFPVSFQALAE